MALDDKDNSSESPKRIFDIVEARRIVNKNRDSTRVPATLIARMGCASICEATGREAPGDLSIFFSTARYIIDGLTKVPSVQAAQTRALLALMQETIAEDEPVVAQVVGEIHKVDKFSDVPAWAGSIVELWAGQLLDTPEFSQIQKMAATYDSNHVPEGGGWH